MVETLLERVASVPRFAHYGRATRVVGLVIEAVGLDVAKGELCEVRSLSHDASVLAEVVGFHERGVLLMPLGEVEGIHPGSAVVPLGRSFGLQVGPGLLGRTLDGLGRPMDGLGDLGPTVSVPLSADPPNPLARRPIDEPMATGVRALDGVLTVGRGQRIGIFAGSGVGKSTLLGMIARHAQADVNVIALLGERGREVRDFIQNSLGPEGLARSVLVVATGDQSALVRARGALVATAIAEYFRDQGKQVLLMLDSVTRVAMAWREIGLAVGEPPTTRGYPPSVFAALPRLLERAGNGVRGGITGIYTVLVEGDDFNEPVADHVRGVLDGHVVLSRRLASAGHSRPSRSPKASAVSGTTSSRWTNATPPTRCSRWSRRTGRRRTSSRSVRTSREATPRWTPPSRSGATSTTSSARGLPMPPTSARRASISSPWPKPRTEGRLMAAFRFRLQPVLDLRAQEEQQSAQGLAMARVEADEARRAREDLESLREAGRVRLAQAHGSGGPVGHLQNLAMVVGSVDAHVEAAHDQCRVADERVVESVKAFHEAFRQRRSIDQLRERRFEEWRTEQNRTEQKTMDEVALTRHGKGPTTSTGETR